MDENLRHLQQFYVQNERLFADAMELPQFFAFNLVSPYRVVKVFENDAQANIRIFYYQYLKLCFGGVSQNSQIYIKQIENLLNEQGFEFFFLATDDPSFFNKAQFRSLILEFFQLLRNSENISIEAALNSFIIMDQVLVSFFRTVLILLQKTSDLQSPMERTVIFDTLCEYFNVSISYHDYCVKFNDTDIFAYEQVPGLSFMTYMDFKEEEEEQEANYDGEGLVQDVQQVEEHQSMDRQRQEKQELLSELMDRHAVVERQKDFKKIVHQELVDHQRKAVQQEHMSYTDSEKIANQRREQQRRQQQRRQQQRRQQQRRQQQRRQQQRRQQQRRQQQKRQQQRENKRKQLERAQLQKKAQNQRKTAEFEKQKRLQAEKKEEQKQRAFQNNYVQNIQTTNYNSNNATAITTLLGQKLGSVRVNQSYIENEFVDYTESKGLQIITKLGKDISLQSQALPARSIPNLQSDRESESVQSQKYSPTNKSFQKGMYETAPYSTPIQPFLFTSTQARSAYSPKAEVQSIGFKPLKGLNVERDFTSESVRKLMSEPCRSNVETIVMRVKKLLVNPNFIVS